MKQSLSQILVAAMATSLGTTALADDASKPKVPAVAVFTLRDSVAGSMIRKDIVSAPVPFDKRYAELTPEQKAIVRQDYVALGPQDDPPFPEAGLRHLVKPLMRQAELDGTRGRFIATVDVGSDGRAGVATVQESPDADISRLAIASLSQETYAPAQCKGQPCAMKYVLRLEFLAPQATTSYRPDAILPR